MSQKVDTELIEAEKWEHCIENSIRKTSYGTLIGGALALLLSRKTGPRIGIAAFGAGTGFGIGYQECSQKFEKGLLLYKKNNKIVAEVKVPKPAVTEEKH